MLAMPAVSTLVEELANFRVKITLAANEVFRAWREGEHDDLVLAVVLACWRAGVLVGGTDASFKWVTDRRGFVVLG